MLCTFYSWVLFFSLRKENSGQNVLGQNVSGQTVQVSLWYKYLWNAMVATGTIWTGGHNSFLILPTKFIMFLFQFGTESYCLYVKIRATIWISKAEREEKRIFRYLRSLIWRSLSGFSTEKCTKYKKMYVYAEMYVILRSFVSFYT
jgi:hypothetical protein